MSRNTSRHATLVSEIKSPRNFLPDFYTNQTCLSCLKHTSPWTSSVHYHLHNGTEFGMTLFEASLGELLLQFIFFSKLLTPRNRIECSDWSVSCFKSSQGGFYLSLA